MQIKTNLKCKNFWGNNEWGQGQYQVVQDLINFRATKPNIAKQTVQKPERKSISKKNKTK